jgi:hypothetical protein
MFGGFMMEVLTGCAPWSWVDPSLLLSHRTTVCTDNALAAGVASGDVTFIVDEKWPGLDTLRDIVENCMLTDPDARPSMGAVLSQIENVIALDLA